MYSEPLSVVNINTRHYNEVLGNVIGVFGNGNPPCDSAVRRRPTLPERRGKSPEKQGYQIMNKLFYRQGFLIGVVLTVLGSFVTAADWQCEGHWLRFRGKPILLIGDSVTQGWMEQGTGFDQRGYVDALAKRGINVLLLWSYIGIVDQSTDDRIAYDAPELWPWVRVPRTSCDDSSAAGQNAAGTFDLAQFNDSYFNRLVELIRYADARSIVVVIQVHDGWPKTRFDGHPFNIINGGPLTDKAQFVELHDYDHEMPGLLDFSWTRQQKHQFYLERFCERLIQATANTPNVIFEIFNEGEWYDPCRLRAFQMHFLNFFRARTSKPLMINDDHIRGVPGFRDESKTDILSHHTPQWQDLPEAKVFFDHYSRQFDALPAKPMFFSEPVPSYTGGDAETEAVLMRLLWGTVLAGASVVIQNDASYGFDPRSAMAVRAGQRDRILDLEGHAARFFRQGLDLTTLKPQGKLASTGVCLANAGKEYIVLAPPGKSFTVNLSAVKNVTLIVNWYDPRTGQYQNAEPVRSSLESQVFIPPFNSNAILHLKAVP